MLNINNDRGTTLLEIMVSLIVIAIAALGGMTLFFQAGKLQAIAHHKKLAIEKVNSKMEECRQSDCPEGFFGVNILGDVTEAEGLAVQDETSIWTGYKEKIVNIGWKEAGPTSPVYNVRFKTFLPSS